MFLLTQHVVMDWNEHNVVYLLFSSLSPPSACVSPSDPTLTVENVSKVMGKMRDWERVARGGSVYPFGLRITRGLGIPYSKLQEIKQQFYTKRDRIRLAAEYWVNTDPRVSWLVLGRALWKERERTALAMVEQYLPKGMCIS